MVLAECVIEWRVMQDLLQLQRETIDRHIRAENAHDWPVVYDTFVQDESLAFYDVIPLHAHFPGLTGVRDFYQAAERAFPDFRIEVWSESDAPGCSLREVTISGTHKGDWCGVAGTGRKVKFHLAGVFLFGTGDQAGKLVAERAYFDNETVLQQINGTRDISTVPSFTPSRRIGASL
jgi:predicted ester cyclase